MEQVKISVMGDKPVMVPATTTYQELAKQYADRLTGDIVLARCNNRLKELGECVSPGNISFLDITDPEGRRVYARGLSFMMLKAVKDLLGLDTKIVIEHSLKKNYYCEILKDGVEITLDLLAEISRRMQAMIDAKLPIVKEVMHPGDAYDVLDAQGMRDKVELFRYKRTSSIVLYQLDGYYDYFYSFMPPSCDYVPYFKLIPHEKGFLMMTPQDENPREIGPFVSPVKISNMFMEQIEWCRLMGVKTVPELNRTIVDGAFGDLVRINEALHEKKFAQIADMICERLDQVKIVLISGPSSSGKTTGANRLCVQLRVNGVTPHVISMDDYFVDRVKSPLGPDGKPDFESVYNVDLEKFNGDLNGLIAGEEILLPKYNFLTGSREPKGKPLRLGPGEICVIEGIHGLNPIVTDQVPEEAKFKIFISAMTQLNVDDHNSISTSDSRMIRRIVRDHQFRGYSAANTIRFWPNVTRGEVDNIFPYQENADVILNSATIYELAVLKPYAEPLLFQIDDDAPEYPVARRLLRFLDSFLGVGSEYVPNNSIIREFIGGSVFHV